MDNESEGVDVFEEGEFEEDTRDFRLIAAEERLQVTNTVLAVAEKEFTRRGKEGTLTPELVDEGVVVLGNLRFDYRVAERNLVALRRELGL